MKSLLRVGLLGVCVALSGCGGNHEYVDPNYHPPAVPASVNAVLRVGDRITISLTGTPDSGYVIEKQIPVSGLITVNYLDTAFQAIGLTPSDLAEQITQAYISKRIYKNPIVTVLPEAQYISIGGEVRGPASVIYRPDLTLMTVINSCGGFTDFANKRSVRIIRGGKVLYYDCNKAVTSPGQDPPVLPGDQIYVPRTIL